MPEVVGPVLVKVPARLRVPEVSLMVLVFCQAPFKVTVPLLVARCCRVTLQIGDTRVPPMACSEGGALPPGPLLVTEVPVMSIV